MSTVRNIITTEEEVEALPQGANRVLAVISKVRAESVGYYLNVGLAVFFVWRAGEVDDHDSIFYLFAATYVLIHAHGRRILSAIEAREEQK